MLTFTATGPASFRLTGGPAPLTVFSDKPAKDGITLLATPQESDSGAVISWPGEYNLQGVSIKGIGQFESKQVSYEADVDSIRCGFLSAPLQDWTDKQLETLGEIDVLVMPAGETKLVQKLVDEIDPRVLILLPGNDKDALKLVEKVIGVKERTSEYKLKGSLPVEGREVVVLA